MNDPEFDPDFVRTKSGAAAGLCAWVINIIKFFEVYCDVEPKRRALAQANAELAAAQEKLSVIKRKVQSLEEQLSNLTADFEQATADKLRCQKEADATQATIQLANRLVGGLASENVRWAQAVAEYDKFSFISWPKHLLNLFSIFSVNRFQFHGTRYYIAGRYTFNNSIHIVRWLFYQAISIGFDEQIVVDILA